MFERQIDRYLRLIQSNRIICGFAWAAMAVSHMLSVKRDTDWQSQRQLAQNEIHCQMLKIEDINQHSDDDALITIRVLAQKCLDHTGTVGFSPPTQLTLKARNRGMH